MIAVVGMVKVGISREEQDEIGGCCVVVVILFVFVVLVEVKCSPFRWFCTFVRVLLCWCV